MTNQGLSMPSGYGGLMRYNDEYESPFKLSPEQVIFFVVAIVIFVTVMKVFWPLG